MNTKSLLCLVILISFCTGIVSAQEMKPGKYKLTWSDEFDGTEIDQNKWDIPNYNRRNNDNGPDGWWSPDDAYLDGEGHLVIRVRKIENRNDDDDPYDYSTAGIRTRGKFEQRYGRFEARCKLPAQQGWWVAFWMMQGNVGSIKRAGKDGSEVDIMEGFGWTDKINLAIHYNGYGAEHKSVTQKVEIPGIREGWHTYTLDWSRKEYIFYIDGREVWRTRGGTGPCRKPGYIKLSGEISTKKGLSSPNWANDPKLATYPDSFLVDYVRVYR